MCKIMFLTSALHSKAKMFDQHLLGVLLPAGSRHGQAADLAGAGYCFRSANGSPAGRPHFKQTTAKGEVRTSPPNPSSFRANVPLPPQHRTESPGFPHQNAQILEANRNSGNAAKADTSARC